MSSDQPFVSPQGLRIRSVMEQANRFAADHLKACCMELNSFYETGILEAGRVRELAGIFREIDMANALDAAIGAVTRQAVLHVATAATGVQP